MSWEPEAPFILPYQLTRKRYLWQGNDIRKSEIFFFSYFSYIFPLPYLLMLNWHSDRRDEETNPLNVETCFDVETERLLKLFEQLA